MVLKMLLVSTLNVRKYKNKILGLIFWLLVYGVTYVHWDSDSYWPIHWKFYERYNYSLIPTSFRDFYDKVYDKVGWIVSDIVWYLVDNGPRDLAVSVWFTGVGLLVCFLKFTNYSNVTKNCVCVAFLLFIFGWLCYCFW